jgi:hypothetical protein
MPESLRSINKTTRLKRFGFNKSEIFLWIYDEFVNY